MLVASTQSDHQSSIFKYIPRLVMSVLSKAPYVCVITRARRREPVQKEARIRSWRPSRRACVRWRKRRRNWNSCRRRWTSSSVWPAPELVSPSHSYSWYIIFFPLSYWGRRPITLTSALLQQSPSTSGPPLTTKLILLYLSSKLIDCNVDEVKSSMKLNYFSAVSTMVCWHVQFANCYWKFSLWIQIEWFGDLETWNWLVLLECESGLGKAVC